MKGAVYFIISLVGIFFAAGFPSNNSTSNTEPFCNFTAKDYANADIDNAILLDVRTQREFDSGHLEGAVLVDIYKSNFRSEINKLDKKKNYFVYCKTGSRSKSTVKYMIQSGFKNACNLEGGIIQLSNAGVKIVK
jgi:rhodanese-related sulfurtransferase